MSVHVTQTLKVVLDTGIDVTGAGSLAILYRQPNGTEGSWTATQVSSDETKIESENTIPDDRGVWTFQAKVVISGKTYYGTMVSQYIDDVLDN